MKKNKTLEYYLSLPYKTVTHFEPRDNSWVATHPELGQGSCYAIGNTEDEARKLLEEEKKFLLEFAFKEGKEIPEPIFEDEDLPSGQFLVRIPKTLHRALREIADNEGISLNQYVLSTLSQSVGFKKAISEIAKSMSTQWSAMAFNAPRFILWDNENLGKELSNWSDASLNNAFEANQKDNFNLIFANQLTGKFNVKVAKVSETKEVYSKSSRLQEVPN